MANDFDWVGLARGIDVSHWKTVKSWPEVRASGVSFVGVKATEGIGYIDPTLRSCRDAVRATGFELAIYYHFARSGSARGQAERLMDAVGSLLPNERLCLDLEVVPTPQDTSDAIAWVKDWVSTVLLEVPDRNVILYTSRRIWRMLGNPAFPWTDKVDLWVPGYRPLAAGPPLLPNPWAGKGWTFWQWSDGEYPPWNTPGVGSCDVNVFAGDVGALTSYASNVRPAFTSPGDGSGPVAAERRSGEDRRAEG